MAENFSDIGIAFTAVENLKRAVSAATEPVVRLRQAFFEAGAAVQRSSAASAATYRADLRRMVAEREISLREAIGLEIDYTTRRGAEDRAQLTNALANDAASLWRQGLGLCRTGRAQRAVCSGSRAGSAANGRGRPP